MDDIKQLVDAPEHASLEMTKHYEKSPTVDEASKLNAMLLTLKNLPFKLDDYRDFSARRDLPSIANVWTTFSKIKWFESRRDDFELIRANGAEALRRLMPVALRDTNQSTHVAGFLLNLYNGERFHFDLDELGSIDHVLILDCISVLMMNVVPGPEIHEYFENGNRVFEGLAKNHGFIDYTKKL